MQRITTGIIIFDQIEVLDFCGPFEVFSVTRLNEEQRREEPSPFQPVIVAENTEPVTTAGGMRVIPDYCFDACPELDILVVPGGWGVRKQMENPSLLQWLKTRGSTVQTLAAVCTGSMLLGAAGLLSGRHATTHWRSLDWMQTSFPDVTVERDQHVVIDGSLITSAGISAGIDMALTVVGIYCGSDVAAASARHMEYPFNTSNTRRI